MNIKSAFTIINQMQADGVIANYAVGGAVGAMFYLEPAQTYDVDVFIILNPKPGRVIITLEDIHEYLTAQGWQIDQQGNSNIGGVPVQFIPAVDTLLVEALEQSVERDYDGVPVRVFTAPHLAAIALKVGRSKDKVRLLQFVESDDFSTQDFSSILTRFGLLERWRKFKSQMTE